MRLDYYEQAYTTDPLAILLMAEDEEECAEGAADTLESERRAALHRTAPKQADFDRITGHHYGE